MNIRCSIIGPERGRATSLLEWVLGQSPNSIIDGYVNHSWNGVTTWHFGLIVRAIIEGGLFDAKTVHLVPKNVVSKRDLVVCIAKAFGRGDIKVNAVNAATAVDRTLSTLDEDLNLSLWKAAGFEGPLTVEEMVHQIGA
jgi:dTDP-4-dehydrorhamnose reductase